MHYKHSPLSYLAVACGTLLFYMCVIPHTVAQDQQEVEEIADRINGAGTVQAIGFQVIPNEYEVEYENE